MLSSSFHSTCSALVLLGLLGACQGITDENRKEHRNPEDIESPTPDPGDTTQTDPGTSEPICEARVTDTVETNSEDGVVTGVRTESMAYDSERRLTQHRFDFETDGLDDYIFHYFFDNAGNPVADEYDYDADEVMDLIIDRTFDADGNVLTVFRDNNADGVYTTGDYFTYDAEGREVLWEYDSGMDGVLDESVATVYDDRGNIVEELRLWGSTTTYSYDANDCLLMRLYTDGAYASRTTYQCDDQGRWTWSENDDLDDGFVEYTDTWSYDALGRQIEFIRQHFGALDTTYRHTYGYGDGEDWTLSETDYESDGIVDEFHDRSFDGSGYLVAENGENQFWLGFDLYQSVWAATFTNDDQGNPTFEEGFYQTNGDTPRDWTRALTYLPCP